MNNPLHLTMLQKANLEFRAGDYGRAIELYEETISQNPELKEIVSANIAMAQRFIAKSETATKAKPAGANPSMGADDSSTLLTNQPISQEATVTRNISELTLEEHLTLSLSAPCQRLLSHYDHDGEQAFLKKISAVPIETKKKSRKFYASVIMPTYNRAATLKAAIDSVIAQTHKIWELIIIDDGSTDDTHKVLKPYKKDKRIKVIQGLHKGVSAARNQGLEIAVGDYIYYLDSDNTWVPNFLEIMNLSFMVTGRGTGYASLLLHDEHMNVIGYRGEPFDRAECLHANYVDINIFAHKRDLLLNEGPYDTALRRMVDWDLILRYTNEAPPFFAPFIGCHYLESRNDANRITLSEPLAFQKVVRLKNTIDSEDRIDISKQISLNITIKIPAPEAEKEQWGDYHYADSLRIALEEKGHKVSLDFHGKWYARPASAEDVVIVLRGLTSYIPRKGAINIMWNISHPDQVTLDEYNSYDLVYVASSSHAEFLKPQVRTKVVPLLQCSDPKRFRYVRPEKPRSTAMLFVGNSRNEYRPIVRKAIESGHDIAIYGSRWSSFVDSKYIKAENISNTELCSSYASHHIVLNDHWESMREYGFVSNRVYDVLASGSTLVTDPIPSITWLFGSTVVQLEERKSFESASSWIHAIDDAGENQRRSVAEFVNKHHSFDNRANVICDDILDRLGLPAIWSKDYKADSGDTRFGNDEDRLHLVILRDSIEPLSQREYVRLISPLTNEFAHQDFKISLVSDPTDPQILECYALIIGGTSVKRKSMASALLDKKSDSGFKIYIDFQHNHLLQSCKQSTHDQKQALKLLMRHADHVWFATSRLELAYGDLCNSSSIVQDSLDVRFWRNYRAPRPSASLAPRFRMLVLADDKNFDDLSLVVQALDWIAAKRGVNFQLVILGTAEAVPERPWIKYIQPNTKRSAYPHYAEWLMRAEKFDIGLIPRAAPGHDQGEHDQDFLHMTALGLPVVCSRSWVYEPLIKRGLAIGSDGEAEKWASALTMVMDNRELMVEMAHKAWEYLWHERCTNITAKIITGDLKRECAPRLQLLKKISPNKPKVAVCLHLYYTEQWAKISQRIKLISEPFDLFVSCMPDHLNLVTADVHKLFPQATIVSAENGGMDVLPFLTINHDYALWSYSAVLKLHTKNTKTDDDAIFGNLCYESLLASPESIKNVVYSLEHDPEVGMIGPEALYRSAKSLMYVNAGKVQDTLTILKIKPSRNDWGFFAGTMFWIRGSLLRSLADNFSLIKEQAVLDCSVVKSGGDGTWAHAMERIFGLLAPTKSMTNQALFISDSTTRDWRIRTIDDGEFQKSLSYRVSSKWHLGRFANLARWMNLCKESAYFDSVYYLQNSGGMIPVGMDPAIHYILYGDDLALDPSADFSTSFYKARHPDVIKARVPFLVHYLVCGIKEGRTICRPDQY
ncbi:glycosyltransferase [Pseudomonas fulva]|uniref:glycosyltransferase n=1 Tax=Pseudomonas fulva TaxID=47880 RepID=UPI0018AA5E71|nr:glycosyltransferase [Pseudomonas fulva]MBF8637508.1 glycosyltransferase [Pseudomonas fulva]MBF8689497.1 glycosyltransferase [Pseudomonas fulva]